MEIRVPLNNTLREGSRNYYSNARAFMEWNECHDPEHKIADYLKPLLKGKEVLDLGCGYGKHAKWIQPISKNYFGIDVSTTMLKIAKRNGFVPAFYSHFIKCSAEKTPFANESFDVVISLWGAISVVKDLRRKAKILKEAERVLKKGGSFYVVRDDHYGEWVRIKRRQKSHRGYNWLLNNGFRTITRIETCFEFKSTSEAKRLMHSLFGRKVSASIKKRKIKLRLMIMEKVKA